MAPSVREDPLDMAAEAQELRDASMPQPHSMQCGRNFIHSFLPRRH